VEHFWRGKSVLVTGASGFLGGWLIRELLALDANVVALVRRRRPDAQLTLAGLEARVKLVTGNVWDKDLLDSIMVRERIDVVFHTAMSGGGVQATLAAPIECLRSTVESTWLLLDGIRRLRPEAAMIVCSSDKAYGAQELPYRETQPLLPTHPQEVAKAAQDLLTQSFGKVYGMNVGVTRCGNFFGPFDFNFTRIIPYVAKCCALGEVPELRSDGLFVRDYLYIQEAAQAHLLLAEAVTMRPDLRGEVFNFSYEIQMTVLEIVERILRISGVDLRPIVVNTLSHEIPNMTLSCAKAQRELNWLPKLDFEAALVHTAAWYREYFARNSA